MNTALPTPPHERMHLLDILRGFALLGILLMNIEYFQRPLLAMMHGFNTEQSGIDYATAWAAYTFFQGKFYTMFSLLFGMGFVLFLDRAMQKSDSPRGLFVRRTLVLALIGLVHIVFIWAGDILLTYAICGLLLLIFATTSAAKLWKWGAALIIIPLLLMWLSAFGIQSAANAPEGAEFLGDLAAQQQDIEALIGAGEQVYAHGSVSEVIQYRLQELAVIYGGGGVIFMLPTILGTMLIGASFARTGIFNRPAEHMPALKNMLIFGVVIGLPSALFVGTAGLDINMMIPDYTSAQVMSAQAIANIGLCFAYMAAIALIFLRAQVGSKLLQRLAPAGRMALTNYLMHSVVFTLLFYGYGLGLYGEFGRFGTTLMAIALYAGQLWFSHWWLQRYQYGPMEWVWRSATYLKLQPMRR